MSHGPRSQCLTKVPIKNLSAKDRLKQHLTELFPTLESQEIDKLSNHYTDGGLTIEQRERLHVLEDQHAEATKRKKIQQFKVLPKNMRETIVANIEAERACAELCGIEAEPEEELKKLRTLRSIHPANAYKEDGSRDERSFINGINNSELISAHTETLLLEDSD